MSDKQDAAEDMKKALGNTAALAISFDTTGSMGPAIASVRQNLRNLVEKMTQDIPGLKIGLISHGDYCDGPNCIQSLDLTDDLEQIMNFISNTPTTSGGDAPECYELALRTAKGFSWPAEGGSFILIGDEIPHGKNENVPSGNGDAILKNRNVEMVLNNPDNIDWREEMAGLKEKNVAVFAMQCLHNPNLPRNAFWEEVSQIAQTPLIILDNFNDTGDMLAAAAYASAGEEHYEKYLADADMGGKLGFAAENVATNRAKFASYSKAKTEKKE